MRQKLDALAPPKVKKRELDIVKIEAQTLINQFDYTREQVIKESLVHDLLDQASQYADFIKEYRPMFGGELGRLYTMTLYVADMNNKDRKE